MSYGNHGSTFGGNPVACAAGFAMVQMLDIPQFERIKHLGKVFEEALDDIVKKHSDLVREARGLGLMWGLELKNPGAWLVDELRERYHILANCTHERVLRLLPPFIINEKDIAYLADSLGNALANHVEKGAKE
jgi:acetylornithine/succinyldiaminopimelate/putrescine aminotransferase